MMKRWLFIAAFVFASVSCGNYDYNRIKAVKVFDGDTIKLANGEKVRLIGLDCPEMHESDKLFHDAKRAGQDIAAIQAMGQAAYQFVEPLVLGKMVRLEFDVEQKDTYGRLLAYVWVDISSEKNLEELVSNEIYETQMETEKDGRPRTYLFLNATIISAGYAAPMTIAPNVAYADNFKNLYQQAREAKRGLWQ